ncbi:hypothetical protein NPIL_616111 [Nephila pilipes]|uniref:Uncharacterized protein n=1 Tax=Nephila pilipes TaxID=299642 RepID=A0A8X6UKM9_NEPPI|nr:hypothetical protein NPIL_616111 [Nephila pilipes]
MVGENRNVIRIACSYIASDPVYVDMRGIFHREVILLPPRRRVVGRGNTVRVELDWNPQGMKVGGAMILGAPFRGRRLQGQSGRPNRISTPKKVKNV